MVPTGLVPACLHRFFTGKSCLAAKGDRETSSLPCGDRLAPKTGKQDYTYLRSFGLQTLTDFFSSYFRVLVLLLSFALFHSICLPRFPSGVLQMCQEGSRIRTRWCLATVGPRTHHTSHKTATTTTTNNEGASILNLVQNTPNPFSPPSAAAAVAVAHF